MIGIRIAAIVVALCATATDSHANCGLVSCAPYPCCSDRTPDTSVTPYENLRVLRDATAAKVKELGELSVTTGGNLAEQRSRLEIYQRLLDGLR